MQPPALLSPHECAQGFLLGMVLGHSIGLGLSEGSVSMSRLRESASNPAIPISLPSLSPDLRFQMGLADHFLSKDSLSKAELQALFLEHYKDAERNLGPQTERVLDGLRDADTGGKAGAGSGADSGKSVDAAPEPSKEAREIAREVWEASGHQAAGSGALRRLPILVLADLASGRKMEQDAINLCEMTHPDPRCLGAALAFCRLSSALLRGRWKGHADTSILLIGLVPQITQALQAASALPAASLSTSGYVVTTLQTAYHTLLRASDFAHSLLDLLRRDKALLALGTVAGAFLGARFGQAAIPEAWLQAAPGGETWLSLARLLPAPEKPHPPTLLTH